MVVALATSPDESRLERTLKTRQFFRWDRCGQQLDLGFHAPDVGYAISISGTFRRITSYTLLGFGVFTSYIIYKELQLDLPPVNSLGSDLIIEADLFESISLTKKYRHVCWRESNWE